MCIPTIQLLDVPVKFPSCSNDFIYDTVIQLVVPISRMLPFPPGVLPRCRNDIPDLSSVQIVFSELLDVILQV